MDDESGNRLHALLLLFYWFLGEKCKFWRFFRLFMLEAWSVLRLAKGNLLHHIRHVQFRIFRLIMLSTEPPQKVSRAPKFQFSSSTVNWVASPNWLQFIYKFYGFLHNFLFWLHHHQVAQRFTSVQHFAALSISVTRLCCLLKTPTISHFVVLKPQKNVPILLPIIYVVVQNYLFLVAVLHLYGKLCSQTVNNDVSAYWLIDALHLR